MRIKIPGIVFLATISCTLAFAADWQSAIAKFKNLNTLKKEVIAERRVVAPNQWLASSAGQQILMRGGNAIDALIATFVALSVVQPAAMSPFGSGFINVYTKDGKSITLDNYTVAPAKAGPDMYRLEYPDDERKQAEAGHVTVGEENVVGFKAIVVPGGIKAWLWALKNYGSKKLSLREILQPSIDYCERGFPASAAYVRAVQMSEEQNARFPGWIEEFVSGGEVPKVGDSVYRRGYAVTLNALADAAPKGAGIDEQLEAAAKRFYLGDIGRNIVGYIKDNGGLLSVEDMTWYFGSGLDDMSQNQGLRLREPVRGTYRGYDVIAMPPTSSGGTHIVEILNILEGFDLKSLGFGNPKTMHLMTEAMKIAWADRDALCFDKTTSDNIKASSRRHSQEHLSRRQRMDIQSSELADDFPWFGRHFGSAKVCDETGGICEKRPADYAAQRS